MSETNVYSRYVISASGNQKRKTKPREIKRAIEYKLSGRKDEKESEQGIQTTSNKDYNIMRGTGTSGYGGYGTGPPIVAKAGVRSTSKAPGQPSEAELLRRIEKSQRGGSGAPGTSSGR